MSKIKPVLLGIAALVIGSVFVAWLVLLASVGLLVPMLMPLGMMFLATFLVGLLMPRNMHWLHIPLALPMTLAAPSLALRIAQVAGLRPALFWVALALLVWLACRFGIASGCRYRKKHAGAFSVQQET